MRDWRAEVSRRLEQQLDPRGEAEIVEELAQHLDDRYRELRAQGLSDVAAEAAVLSELDDDPELGATIDRALKPLPAESVPIGASRSALAGGAGFAG